MTRRATQRQLFLQLSSRQSLLCCWNSECSAFETWDSTLFAVERSTCYANPKLKLDGQQFQRREDRHKCQVSKFCQVEGKCQCCETSDHPKLWHFHPSHQLLSSCYQENTLHSGLEHCDSRQFLRYFSQYQRFVHFYQIHPTKFLFLPKNFKRGKYLNKLKHVSCYLKCTVQHWGWVNKFTAEFVAKYVVKANSEIPGSWYKKLVRVFAKFDTLNTIRRRAF